MHGKTLVFVPTYNEIDNAPRMARSIAAIGLDADILFVDDGSPDGTGDALDNLKREIPRLFVEHRTGKLGIGSAHRDAINWAYARSYATLVTLDCDFTHSPSDIPRLLQSLCNHDVIVGSRWSRRGSLPGWNAYRRTITFLGHLLTRVVLGVHQDASGAFRAYNLRCVPRELFDLVRSNGYSFFFESLFVLRKNNFDIGEVAIVLPARTYGSSKMSFLAAVRSATYIFQLALESCCDPRRFRLRK
jgi:dolichol-phosphate mannosyltransferase